MRSKPGNTGFMAIKIDFEKAYDRLRWDFIDEDTLNEIWFPVRLIQVIMECATISSMKVLWKREPTTSYKPSRGIQQGDPPLTVPILFFAWNDLIKS